MIKKMDVEQEIVTEELIKEANEGVEIATLVLQKFYYGKEEVIGWEELNNKLVNFLCNAIGDEEFQKL